MNMAANVQGVLQQHFAGYSRTHKLDGQRLKVCRHLLRCHKPALGGIQYPWYLPYHMNAMAGYNFIQGQKSVFIARFTKRSNLTVFSLMPM